MKIKKLAVFTLFILLVDIFILGFTIVKITGSSEEPVEIAYFPGNNGENSGLPQIDATNKEKDAKNDEGIRELKLPVNNKSNAEKPAVSKIDITSRQVIKENVSTIKNPQGSLVLVNKFIPVTKEYVPEGLENVSSNTEVNISVADPEIKLKSNALSALVKMFIAAKKDGINGMIVTSGYRSYEQQEFFHRNKVKLFQSYYGMKDAEKEAATVVAPPGKSEHQTGLAVDLTTNEVAEKTKRLDVMFADTPEGKWIYKNCWKFGFVVRYDSGKTNITGIISEPWHIRYVGLPHSEIMKSKNFCLEEYIGYLKKNKSISHNSIDGKKYEIKCVKKDDGLTWLDNAKVTDLTIIKDEQIVVTRIVG